MRNTPDASGNVWNELERIVRANFATKQYVRANCNSPQQEPNPVPMNEIHCSGQRGAYKRRR